MNPATPKVLAVTSGALVTITGLVLYQVLAVERSPDTDNPRRFVVQWPDGGPTGDLRGIWTTALVSNQPVQLPDGGVLPSPLGIYGARTDAGPQYAYARICAVMPDDGGPSDDLPLPDLPPGMEAMEFDQIEADCVGGPQLLAVLQGQPEWPCACARAPEADAGSCEWETMDWEAWVPIWAEAPIGVTLSKWRGPGCYPKSCVELAGVPSWPSECPQ